ncbi:MAG: hypothetical protein K2P94_13190 [Rhodospirillaceae bacterium]|nr:hypothetical protein [Rhodospirillaceae bacterium]
MAIQRIKFVIDLLPSPGANKPKYLSVKNPANPASLTAEVMPIAEYVDDDDDTTDTAKPAKIVWICRQNPSAGGTLDFFNAGGDANDKNDEVLKIVNMMTGAAPPAGLFKNKKIFPGQGNGTPTNGSRRLSVRMDYDPAVGSAPVAYKYALTLRWRPAGGGADEYYIFDPMITGVGRY